FVNDQMKSVVQEIEVMVQTLQQREHEVFRAERLAAVGQLAAGIAHELRNPLTSIKILVQTNREEAEKRGMPAEDLKFIEQEATRMERCLQNFLDFARPPKVERRSLDLAEIVNRSLTLVGARARKQNVRVNFQSHGLATVVGDAELLQQLVVNLLLNALDAMPSGGVLELTLDVSDHRVVLQVLDTGHGIPASVVERLFEPFVSSKETGL